MNRQNNNVKSTKNLKNQKGETFGFSSDEYQSFVRAYSELSYAMAHNDYAMISLFHLVREQIGKKNFATLLSSGLRFNASEVSDLNRKLSAFEKIPSQVVWNTIGYRGIQKIMSMPTQNRDRLLASISSKGDNFTVKDFSSLYSSEMGRNSDRNSDQKSESQSESAKRPQKSRKQRKEDRKNERSSDSSRNDRKSDRNSESITMTRGDLESIVRQTVARALGSRKGNQKQGQRSSKKNRSSKLSNVKLQALIV